MVPETGWLKLWFDPQNWIFLTFEIEWFPLEIGTVESMISPPEDRAGQGLPHGRACRAGLSNDPAGLMALIDAERREYLGMTYRHRSPWNPKEPTTFSGERQDD